MRKRVRALGYLAAGHAVEEELLRLEAGEEAVRDEAAGARTQVVREERGQTAAGEHHRRPAALELDLPDKARDLHRVDRRALRARHDHQLQRVPREPARQPVRHAHSAKVDMWTLSIIHVLYIN